MMHEPRMRASLEPDNPGAWRFVVQEIGSSYRSLGIAAKWMALGVLAIVAVPLVREAKIGVDSAFGAFFGALCAYWFQRWKDGKDGEDARYAAILRAQATHIFHLNSLGYVMRDLEKFRHTPNRERAIQVFYFTKDRVFVDIESLSFFLDGKTRNVMMPVYLADKGYHNAADAIIQRNDYFAKIHENAVVQSYNSDTRQMTFTGIEPWRMDMLKDFTTAMFKSIDKAIRQNEDAVRLLHDAGKAVFPKRKFLTAGPIQKAENQAVERTPGSQQPCDEPVESFSAHSAL